MWPFATPAEWEAFLQSQGVDPATGVAIVQPQICEICKEDLPDTHVVLDPPAGTIFGRKFHVECLIVHLCEHIDDLTDDISNHALKERI